LSRNITLVTQQLDSVVKNAGYGFPEGSGACPHFAKVALSNLSNYLKEKPLQLSQKDWELLQTYKNQRPW
jgi:hypothetical protein